MTATPTKISSLSAAATLAKLVSFDTTSHKSNLELISWIEKVLEKWGVKSQRVPSACGQKASLFASIKPSNGSSHGGIGLSGHTDVVPVKGQDWEHDPFTLRAQTGRLYGRGSCDMKGFLACMLAAVPDFVSRDLRKPIHLVFSYDEEVGCTGVRPMLAKLAGPEEDAKMHALALPRPDIVIVGEPTNMQVVEGHKGIYAFETKVTGAEAHSSTPALGVNAVMIAARLIGVLEDIGSDLQATKVERFDPPYTSVHVGTINGGFVQNIIPKSCRFSWEFRMLPGPESAENAQKIIAQFEAKCTALLPKMRAVSPLADIETTQVHHVPGFGAKARSEAVSLALQLAGQNETHFVSYGTEAGLFEAAGCSTVVCGPGSIAQAHKPNEYIEQAELDKCMAFMSRLADFAAR